MKIARILDEHGDAAYAEQHSDGRFTRLSGQLAGGFERTASSITGNLIAPLVPVNIFAIGLNYRAHAQEGGFDIPVQPVVFMKPTSAVTGPTDAIRIPKACEHGPEVDYEGELAVIIGREARDVPVERALEHVFGYACANDVSARRWQKHGGGGQWNRGKSFDTFCPLGPVIVTADELPDPQALAIKTTLNGEEMQTGHTSDMIFTVAEIISFLSRDTTLLPGTAILTGTPPGVGFARRPPVFLRDGDTVQVEIESIGAINNPVLAAS